MLIAGFTPPLQQAVLEGDEVEDGREEGSCARALHSGRWSIAKLAGDANEKSPLVLPTVWFLVYKEWERGGLVTYVA